MGDFFDRWQRKAGCVTLVMACALSVAWMRGRDVTDVIEVGTSTGLHEWQADAEGLSWSRHVNLDNPDCWIDEPFRWKIYVPAPRAMNDLDLSRPRPDPELQVEEIWQTDFAGICVLKKQERVRSEFSVRVERWTIDYANLLIVLTILSADLILWTRRKQTGI